MLNCDFKFPSHRKRIFVTVATALTPIGAGLRPARLPLRRITAVLCAQHSCPRRSKNHRPKNCSNVSALVAAASAYFFAFTGSPRSIELCAFCKFVCMLACAATMSPRKP